ncbi:hypothetical protein K438DRAFT_1753603 [Mycena galopus ATCC 62051]|nr:hypothetical protein K438DRAFT_1753603 [Mycena galopus ATCC 62051]
MWGEVPASKPFSYASADTGVGFSNLLPANKGGTSPVPNPLSLGSASKGFGFPNPSSTNEGATSTAPNPLSFGSASKGFGFPNPSSTNEGGISAAPNPLSFGSASKGFGFPNPSSTNEGGTYAAPKEFSSLTTSAHAFGLPKQSQSTSNFTSPNPAPHGILGNLLPRTGSTQSQTNISSPPPMFPSASVGIDFAHLSRTQTREDGAAPPRDSSEASSTAQAPSPSAFATVWTESKTGGTRPTPPKTYASSSSSEEAWSPIPIAGVIMRKLGTDSRGSAHSQIIGDMPFLRRPSPFESSGKDSDSSKISQLINDFSKLLIRENNVPDDVPPVTSGSSNPSYAPYSEKDPYQTSITNHCQSISCMPAYRGTSFEELRVQDYAQGRKTAGGWKIAMGQSSAFGGALHLHREPRISYNGNNEAWIRYRLIDSKEPILFVGESWNRSLPVALAIMRESWDGIWASSLYEEEIQELPALLLSAQGRSKMNAEFAGRSKKSSPWKSVPEMRHKLSELTKALDPKSQDEVVARFSLVVDAIRLKLGIQGPTRHIWFQCPWILRSNSMTTTAKLLEGFISSAATIQQSGDAVFVGLTAYTLYRKAYDLDNLKNVAHRLGYEIFMDEWFILHAIDAGYKHESVSTTDIHRLLLDHHQTFVLVKRWLFQMERSEHTSMKEQISTERKKLEAQLEAQLEELKRHLRDLCERDKELSLVDEAMT